MLFDHGIQPRCEYCLHGRDIGCGEIACLLRGITGIGYSCRKFRYDPLKREPEVLEKPDFLKLSEKDFEL